MFFKKIVYLIIILLMTSLLSVATDSASLVTMGAIPDDDIDDANAFRLAMSSKNTKIYVPGGRYILKNLQPYIPLSSRKEIICAPETVFFVPKNAKTDLTTTRHGYTFKPVFGVSNTDPLITNFTIRGCSFVIESSDVTPIFIDKENARNILIDSVVIDGKGGLSHNQAIYGVLVNNGNDVTIRDTKISYTRGPAIVMRLPRKAKIERNEITYSGVDAKYTEKGPELAEYKVDYWNSAGISCAGASGCSITKNTIDWTGGAGIILRGGEAACENNTIASNKLTNIGKGGIGIGINNGGNGDSQNNIIKDNIIKGYMQRWSDAAININHRGPKGTIRNITIVNNFIDLFGPNSSKIRFPTHFEFTKTYGSQIILDPSETGSIENIIIKGNVLKNAIGPAIVAKKISKSSIIENSIHNACRALSESIGYDNNKTVRYPIMVSDAFNIKINSNKIFTNTIPFINIVTKQGEIKGNSVYYCGKAIIPEGEKIIISPSSILDTTTIVSDNAINKCTSIE